MYLIPKLFVKVAINLKESIKFASDLIQVQVPIRSFDYCKLNDTTSKGHQICAGDDNIGEEKDACVVMIQD